MGMADPAGIMRIVGLLGGVASGKSLVARQLGELGAGVLDADRAGHEVLRMPRVVAAARARWGEAILSPDGGVDRSRLAKIVFADAPEGPQERDVLEQLTHPEIGRLLREQAAHLASDGFPVAVLDAPLLLESRWDQFCDVLVLVDSPWSLRLERAGERGWSEEDFAAREDAQETLEVKRERADVVVDNSGSPEATQAQVERLWHCLVG